MQGNTGADKQQGQGNQKQGLSWSQPAAQRSEPTKSAPSAAPAQTNLPMKAAPAKVNAGQATAGKSNTGLYAGIFIGGLIIGVLVGWGVTGTRHEGLSTTQGSLSAASSTQGDEGAMTTDEASNTGGNAAAMMGGESAGLSIPSQAAGLTVSVAHVSVSAPTWVVIYEDHNGIAGRALGAGLFFPTSQGGATSGTIDLLRGTTPGQTYLAGESLDDGDHKFSTSLDKPVRDDSGNPLWVTFKTQ